MSLIDAYDAAIARGDIADDPLQRKVLESMHRLSLELDEPISSSWLPWRKPPIVKGVYLFGEIGVGKTFLMDLFYQEVREPRKARFHFHHFMQQIDAQLRKRQGQKNPLQAIAADFAQSIRLLCFDEFLVHDVAYAMILGDLLQALFAQGLVLVATSNTAPDNLYRNGVHRERFIPAIELIKARTEVINLGVKKDYRLGRAPKLDAYLTPLGPETTQRLQEQFAFFAPEFQEQGVLEVQNREIPYLYCGERTVWFDFRSICNLPRSQLDYLEIARRFDTIFVSDVPRLTDKDTIHAILLVHFIDVLYDLGLRLILSAAVPLEELYTEGEMSTEFKRTLSRLQEMQSIDYLRRHPWHKARDLV